MTKQHLLPPNATPLEIAVSETIDRTPEIGPYVEAARGVLFARPTLNVTFASWVLDQFGLGGISAYFDTVEDTIDAGIPWSRIRGTCAAIETALAWVEYDDISIEHQFPHRRKWNRYTVEMGAVPATELPRLMDAEYLGKLSDAARSVFFRGFEGYDHRALTWSASRYGDSLWGDDSGVRLNSGTVKWSHGEDDSGAIVAGETERQALGIDVTEGQMLTWGSLPWNAPGITWQGIQDVAAFKSFLLRRLPVRIGFFDAAGDPIGYRLPYAVRDVTDTHAPGGDSIVVEYECRTDFGDGEGSAAARCSLVFRANNTDTTKPGKLWLEPGELAFEDGHSAEDMVIGAVDLDFVFRRTVRQHVTLTLEI